MVLVAILAVFIVPKMTGTAGYDEFIVRDQVISALRFAQQHAMYDQATGHCYRVSITAHGYAVDRSTNSGAAFVPMSEFTLSASGSSSDSSMVSALGKVTLPVLTQRFDGLGNPVATCGGANSGNQAISIAGSTTISLCIYSTGYVRAGACS
jgi:type II secretory pathway pseudopilin PulG